MLTVEKALRAYAAMMNTLDVSKLEPLLADDFHYTSQMVLSEIESKAEYITYITAKLKTLQALRAGGVHQGWAEMGWMDQMGWADHTVFPGPCVVLAQRSREDLVGYVVAKVENGTIKWLAACVAPSPYAATRSGEYPE